MAGGENYAGFTPGNGLQRNSGNPKELEVDEAADFDWTGTHDFTGATVTGLGGGGAHAADHESGGGDEIDIGALDGTITSAQHGTIGAGDLHPEYQRESEKAAASGYASLDGSTLVPTAQLGTGTATSAKVLRGDRTWATLVGAGFASKWNPWTPPGTIHPMGDEFDDSSVAGKWTTWNPSGSALATISEDAWGLKIAGTDDPGATDSWQGVYQPLGADDEHEFIVRLGIQQNVGAFGAVGIGLLEGTTNTSDLLVAHKLVIGSGVSTLGINRYTAYNSASAQTFATNNNHSANSVYVCLQHKLSTNKVNLFWSDDGISWMRNVNDQATTFTAAYVALLVDPIGRDVAGRYEFFRVRSAASGIYNTFPSPLGG
jgi:hypothetical protein